MKNIDIVREDSASTEVKAIYGDIKDSLQIPWVPALFQAFAVYPQFLRFIWQQVKPSVFTEQFRIDAGRIRDFADTFMAEAHIAEYKHEDAVRNGLSVDDLLSIRTRLEAFHYGNPKLLLIAGALYRALEGETIGGNGSTTSAHDDFGSRVIRKIQISPVAESTAPNEVKALYQDMRAALGVPLINTDYQVLANWPGFLKLTWDNIKLINTEPFYIGGAEALFEFSQHAADRFAYPVKMGPAEMQTAGIDEENIGSIRGLIKLFANIIPELILNVAEMQLDTEDLLGVERGGFAA